MTKNTIESLPLHELYNLTTPLQRDQWCQQQGLMAKQNWIWPQILAHYGRWKVQWQDNTLDIVQTLKHSIRTEWDLGLWTLVTKIQRGHLVKHQAAPEHANWSQLVPVILAGLKRDQNIHYNRWPRGELNRVVHNQLWEVIQWADTPQGETCRNLGSEELIKIRTEALVTKTGKTAGKPKNPLSTWTLTGLQDTPLWGAPKLASTMLCQVWVAHPNLRTGYMILDPWDLDRTPASLWGDNLFQPDETIETNSTKSIKELKLPWE